MPTRASSAGKTNTWNREARIRDLDYETASRERRLRRNYHP